MHAAGQQRACPDPQTDQMPAKASTAPSARVMKYGCLAARRPPDPLVPAVGRDQAAAPGERRRERPRGGHRLGPRVDHPGAGPRVVGPRRHQAPARHGQHPGRAAACGDAHDRHRVGRRDVVVGAEPPSVSSTARTARSGRPRCGSSRTARTCQATGVADAGVTVPPSREPASAADACRRHGRLQTRVDLTATRPPRRGPHRPRPAR